MAERQKDNEDLVLEALFRAEPIADDGFCKRVVARVRRRVWTRRVTLPVAVVAKVPVIGAGPCSPNSAFASRAKREVPQPLSSMPCASPIDTGTMSMRNSSSSMPSGSGVMP